MLVDYYAQNIDQDDLEAGAKVAFLGRLEAQNVRDSEDGLEIDDGLDDVDNNEESREIGLVVDLGKVEHLPLFFYFPKTPLHVEKSIEDLEIALGRRASLDLNFPETLEDLDELPAFEALE